MLISRVVWIGEFVQVVIFDFDIGFFEIWVSLYCIMVGWNLFYEKFCWLLGMYLLQQLEIVISMNRIFLFKYIMYGSGEIYIEFYKDVISFNGE